MVVCRVTLLDGTGFEPKGVDKSSNGSSLFEKVCRHLDLVETDYFGLTYRDKGGKKFWLDNSKKISKQVKGGTWVFEFQVKFYPPDPALLKEDLTRYQLCLQLRVDIFNGKLPCSFVTYALLGSYTVQAEMGDYSQKEYGDSIEYLKDFDFAPQQPPELLEKISELHKHLKGQMPAEAENNFLENAKRLAMYGVDKHDAKDSDNKDITLGVCASGILIFNDRLRRNRFVWPKIIKLSYKRNNFYIRIRGDENDKNEKVIGFKLESHKLAKRLWKTCVEHHAFFRLKMGDPPDTSTLFPRFNSKFRYSGRTQAQARKAAEALRREQPHVTRTAERKSMAPADKAKSMDDMANQNKGLGNPDENDMYDKKKGDPTAMMGMGDNNSQFPHGDAKYQNAPGSGGDGTEDRRDLAPGDGERTAGMPGYEGDTSALTAGGLKKGKKDKEEEKRRKKEEEKERKRLEKERKKKGGDGRTSEDRADNIGGGPGATETALDGTADSKDLQHGGLYLQAGYQGNSSQPSSPQGKDKTKDAKGNDKDNNANDKGKDTDGKGKDKDGRGKDNGGRGKDKGGIGMDIDARENDRDGKEKDIDGKDNDRDGKGKDKYGKGKDKDDTGKDKDGKGKDKGKDKEKKGGLFGKFGRKSVHDKDDGRKSGHNKDDKDKDAADNNTADDYYGKVPHYVNGINITLKSPSRGDGGNDQAGMGYGGDFAPGDFGMQPGDSKSIDRKMQFIPITQPSTLDRKDRNKSDEPMPFFDPAADSADYSSLGKRKVPPPVARKPKGGQGFDSEEDRLLRDSPPTVATESYKYQPGSDDLTATSNIPIVETKTHHVTYEKDGIPVATEDGYLISAHSVSTKSQTIETTTFKTERDGLVETRVERKITITGDDEDDTDHDALLRSAIMEVTEMNPNLTVEKIECMRQIEKMNGD